MIGVTMLKTYELRNYNFKLFFLLIVISSMGVIFVNGADASYTKKHIFGLVCSIIIMIFVSMIDYNTICKFWWVLYAFNCIALILVKLIGLEVNGAKRWFKIPGFGTIQPSEFAKIIMIICVAIFLEQHKDNLNTLKTLVKLAVLCAVPIFLIAIETDLSTSIDITVMLIAMIFVAGLSYRIIVTVLAILIPAIMGFLYYVDHAKNVLFLKEYQIGRIRDFLHPANAVDDTGWQQDNSVMAIGSGMLHGKGINSSTGITVKDANLVPEQQTDFIFSVVGEEFGFIGCVFVIAILLLIMLQCIRMARRARNTSGMLIATGIASMICFQSFINISVATKLFPNTGLPLPFISYGLSSLLSCMIGMGLVLNIGLQRRKY